MLADKAAIGTFTPHRQTRDEVTRKLQLTALAEIPDLYPAAVDISLFKRAQARIRRGAKARSKAQITRRLAKDARRRPAKYFGPGGELWSGLGRQPSWFAEALKGGLSLDDYAITTKITTEK
jgi:DNA-binding protein H-NS